MVVCHDDVVYFDIKIISGDTPSLVFIINLAPKDELSLDYKSSLLVCIGFSPTCHTGISLSSEDILDCLTRWKLNSLFLKHVPLIGTIYCQVSSFKYTRGGELSGKLSFFSNYAPPLLGLT